MTDVTDERRQIDVLNRRMNEMTALLLAALLSGSLWGYQVGSQTENNRLEQKRIVRVVNAIYSGVWLIADHQGLALAPLPPLPSLDEEPKER